MPSKSWKPGGCFLATIQSRSICEDGAHLDRSFDNSRITLRGEKYHLLSQAVCDWGQHQEPSASSPAVCLSKGEVAVQIPTWVPGCCSGQSKSSLWRARRQAGERKGE